MKTFRLLVTKKITGSLLLRAGLKGIDILEKEFIKIQPVVSDTLKKNISSLAGSKHTVAFTSKNSVSAVTANENVKGADWKIYCLDGATREEIRKHWSDERIEGTAQNAAGLVTEIKNTNNGKKIVFFCGNLRRDDLPGLLRDDGYEVEEVVVYETILSPETIIDDYDAVAFFSPSAVKSFFSKNTLKKGAVCLSVGRTTTAALKEITKERIVTSDTPSEESVIRMVEEIKNNL